MGQLSVLRAIGSHVSEVVAMVGVEYAGVIIYGVVVGIAIGLVSSYLFVPSFHFSSDPSTALPPFLLQIAWGKAILIAVVFAAALILSQLIVLQNVTRKEFFQMLRIGQHLLQKCRSPRSRLSQPQTLRLVVAILSLRAAATFVGDQLNVVARSRCM